MVEVLYILLYWIKLFLYYMNRCLLYYFFLKFPVIMKLLLIYCLFINKSNRTSKDIFLIGLLYFPLVVSPFYFLNINEKQSPLYTYLSFLFTYVLYVHAYYKSFIQTMNFLPKCLSSLLPVCVLWAFYEGERIYFFSTRATFFWRSVIKTAL